MESATVTPITEKALPIPPRSDSATPTRDGHISPPAKSPARNNLHDSARTRIIRSLEAENKLLKAEIVKNYQLQLQCEEMAEEVRTATELIKNAVLRFRKEQKRIEQTFEEEERRFKDFQASNFF
ncbi:hypothetical protein H2200_013602 [Cladophialophora chaetospira]|uniref:Uncharacterized protein n=1 Tax=Cladophialophora chaetospira TaxID=386627 RepID=A0AA38WPV6_9EURO|nr:hypothetical protein H2200_013602 [Cladophialophora chaetospira]